LLAVASHDRDRSLEVMKAAWEDQFEGDARRSVTHVIDLASSERECPACFAKFEAGPEKCPECGLFIGG
jgi:hypothetical protein